MQAFGSRCLPHGVGGDARSGGRHLGLIGGWLDRRSGLIVRHDRLDADCLVADADWPSIVTFFDGDGAGTLVGEGWVLTAAHTAANIPHRHRIRIAGRETRSTRVIVHPGRLATPPAPIDLALVQLDPPAAGVPILAPFEGDDEAGQELLLLGRGDFGNGRDGVLGTDHRLRRVTNRVDRVDEYWLRFRFDPPPGGTTLEGVGGEGDSGGPALIRVGGLRVAGVSSWQDHAGPLGTYGCVEHYARVSTHVRWIRSVCER